MNLTTFFGLGEGGLGQSDPLQKVQIYVSFTLIDTWCLLQK